ncbi:hypothetical protein POVWA1_043980 [Plasmodium ovale wallikeri]|uniref:Uncharacterized protein n=1 Tax=Plasmodium ovale wallikeri TaxID=864142 RepID=A0A1A8ZC79_PLAOA|nr:hypothetical protein POVWA1_043980 [Plasmodium ovale wallikeri]
MPVRLASSACQFAVPVRLASSPYQFGLPLGVANEKVKKKGCALRYGDFYPIYLFATILSICSYYCCHSPNRAQLQRLRPGKGEIACDVNAPAQVLAFPRAEGLRTAHHASDANDASDASDASDANYALRGIELVSTFPVRWPIEEVLFLF